VCSESHASITPEVPILHNVSPSLITPAPNAPQALSPPPATTATSSPIPNSSAIEVLMCPTKFCDSIQLGHNWYTPSSSKIVLFVRIEKWILYHSIKWHF